MFRCAIVVMPDAFLASVGAMVDAFSLVFGRFGHLVVEPGSAPPEMTLTVLSIDGGAVRTGGGIDYPVDRAISTNDRFDFVWLPSFRCGGSETLGHCLAASQRLIDWLQGQAAAGTTIGASGAAAMFLVAAHLLEGKQVPVSRVFLPVVRTLFPRCHADDRPAYANHGKLLLSKGIANDFPVITQAISQTISPSSGRWLAEVIANDDAGPGHLSRDPLVASAQLWIEQLYATDLTMADLASRLSTSQHTLVRRFRKALGITPKAYAQELRLDAAKAMLSESTRSVEEIARIVGYSDARIFRRAFLRSTGQTAGDWRQSRQPGAREYPLIDE